MKNHLRTSCAPAAGRGNFKKPETEEGAVQPITAAIWFRFASPKFLLHCVPQNLHIAAERYREIMKWSKNFFKQIGSM